MAGDSVTGEKSFGHRIIYKAFNLIHYSYSQHSEETVFIFSGFKNVPKRVEDAL